MLLGCSNIINIHFTIFQKGDRRKNIVYQIWAKHFAAIMGKVSLFALVAVETQQLQKSF